MTWLQADVSDADVGAQGHRRPGVRRGRELPVLQRGRRGARRSSIFRGRTGQYLHISTASLYRKPVLQWPIVESNLRQNPFVSYSRDKIAAEDELMRACVQHAGSR